MASFGESINFTVLVVDDDPIVSLMLVNILKSDYNVQSATTGLEALDIIAHYKVHLVLLDMMLPDTSGTEVCRKLKADRCTCAIPIIFISSNDEIKCKISGFKSGCVDYIPKPFVAEEVKSRVKAQLDNALLRVELESKNDELMRSLHMRSYEIEGMRKVEVKLRQFEMAVGQSSCAIVITNAGGLIEYVNPKFCQLTGYSADEVIGCNPRLLKSGYTPNDIYSGLWACLSKGETWRGELYNKTKSGEFFWASVSIAPIRAPYGTITHFVAIQEDVTDKKLNEMQLIEAKELAESGSRAKSEFIAMINHEMHTPLNSIIGFSELIYQDKNNGSPSHRSFAQIIYESGTNLLSKIDDIIKYAALSAGDIGAVHESVPLKRIIEAALSTVRARAETSGIIIKSSLPDDEICINCEYESVVHAVVHVLSNSIKFSARDTVVELVAIYADDLHLDIMIRDHGIGISEDKVKEIIQPFSQADSAYCRQYEGLGIGLPLAQKIMNYHGGELNLDTAPGIGTSISLYFPPGRIHST